MNYTSGQVQRALALSTEALRLWVLDLEGVMGSALPRDERNASLFSPEVVNLLSRAVAW